MPCCLEEMVSGRVARDGLKEHTRVELAADGRCLCIVVVERSYAIDLTRSHWEEGPRLCGDERNTAAEGKEENRLVHVGKSTKGRYWKILSQVGVARTLIWWTVR